MTFDNRDVAELEGINEFYSVMAFMVGGDQASWNNINPEGFGGDPMSKMRILRRRMLMSEGHGEAFEYLRADLENDLIETLDGLADTIYVAIGTLIKYCKDDPFIAALFLKEVCRSNLSKFNEDGTAIIDEYGKIQKGPNYIPPRIAEMVEYFDLDNR